MKYSYTLLVLLFSFSIFSTIHANAPCDTNTVFSVDIGEACKDGIPDNIDLMNNIGGVIGINHAYILTDVNDNILLFNINNSFYNIDQLDAGEYRIYGLSYQGLLTVLNGMPLATITSTNCVTISSNYVPIRVYDPPTMANAGPDKFSCGPNIIELEADSVFSGMGMWSQISGPSSVTFFPNATTPRNFIVGAASGIYEFEWSVTNGVCPSSSDTVLVEIQTTPLQIDTIYHVDETCHDSEDGSISIELVGAMPPITYDNGQGEVATIGTQSYTFSDLSAGIYPVIITDATGCIVMNTVSINQPDSLELSITPIAESQGGASDGAIEICVDGGTPSYTVTLSPNNPITNLGAVSCDGNYEVNNLVPGNYIVEVKDINGCFAIDTVAVAPGDCFTRVDSVVVNNNVSCNGESNGKMTIFASGNNGFEFSIDNGASFDNSNSSSIVYSNLTGGDYNIIVRDDMGCTDTFHLNPVNIFEPLPFSVTQLNATDGSQPGVNDGQISFCVNGGTPPYLAFYSGTTTSATDFFTDDPSGPCSGNFSVMGLPSDSFQISIVDDLNCTEIFNVFINDVDCSLFDIDAVQIDNVLCNGGNTGSIEISTSGGFAPYTFILDDGIMPTTVTISSPNYTFTGLPAGNYDVTAIHSDQCTQVYDFNPVIVTESTPVAATIDHVNPTTTSGADGVICITPTGGVQPYSVTSDCGTVMTGNGSCGGTFHIENVGSGICNIDIKDANNCLYTIQAVLEDPSCAGFGTSNIESTNLTCNGENNGTITISVNGGQSPYQYSIDNGANYTGNQYDSYTFAGLAPGTYPILVMDDRLCFTDVSSVEITEPDALEIEVETDATCTGLEDGGIDITPSGGTPGYTYFWNTQQMTEDIDQLAAGTYSVTVTDNNACTHTSEIEVPEYTPISVQINGAPLTIELGDSTTLTGNVQATQGYTFEWSPTTGLSNSNILTPIAKPDQTTVYTLTVTSDEGCIYTSDVTITVNEPRELIAIPSAFTPNDDGENDEFKVFIQGRDYEFEEFYVFNRWGEQVFFTDNESQGWNGKYKDEDQPVGTYVYLVKYRIQGTLTNKGGDVTLLR